MPSKKELKSILDRLPSDTPNNIDPQIVDLHREFHESGKINEGVPYSFYGPDQLPLLIQALREMKPSHLQTALEILEGIIYQAESNLASSWARPVLTTLAQIYRDHYLPSDINHRL